MANGKTAIVFPGQGSQRHGMGKDYYESIPECRRIYEEASDALGWDVAALCFGEDEKLNLTAFAQPSIVVTEIAMLKAIMEKYGITPDVFGGHSLGEYTALVAAGVLPLETVIRIVHIRGRLMQEAVPVGQGGMTAVIRKDIDSRMIGEMLSDLPVDVANINSPNQIVISGRSKAMPIAEERIAKALADENPDSDRVAQRERPLPQPLHAHHRGALRGRAGLCQKADEGRKRREGHFQLYRPFPLC